MVATGHIAATAETFVMDHTFITIPYNTSLYFSMGNTYIHLLNGPLSRTTQVSRTRKVKPIWILLEQETVGGSGIRWAVCKSAPRSRQTTTPAPTTQFLQAGCPSCRPTNSVKALKAMGQKMMSSKLPYPTGESGPPSNTWFLGPT